MTSATGEPVRCVGAIIRHAELGLLLIKRANEPGRGLWSIPGGRVEKGESDAEAVRREVREETNLEVIPGTHIGTVSRGPYEIHDYACEIVSGTLRAGDDAADARWATLAELKELDHDGALTDLLLITLSDWGVLPG